MYSTNLHYYCAQDKRLNIHDRYIYYLWIGIGLAILHLALTWRLMGQTDQLIINALFWVAILRQLIKPPQQVGGRPSRIVGLVLLGAIVAKSLTLAHVEAWFVRLFPALAVLSLGLLLSGFRLSQHWRTGLLLSPLMIPRGAVEHMAEQMIGQPSQVVTAQFAAFMLHYLGWEAVQHNTIITLNQGSVDVLFRCTGIPLLIVLLQLALLFLILFSLAWQQQLRLAVSAVLIAFLFSSVRVALMAVVVTDPTTFTYWHSGNGSQLFSTGAIVLFGWFCQQCLPRI